MAWHEDRGTVMIAAVVASLLCGATAHQYRAGRVDLVEEVLTRRNWNTTRRVYRTDSSIDTGCAESLTFYVEWTWYLIFVSMSLALWSVSMTAPFGGALLRG